MCIIFIHDGSGDPASEYQLIVASNRDEIFHRPAQRLGPWLEDNTVIGGKDLEAGGTWLALSPVRKKIAVLLNLPSKDKANAKSRGEIVSSYVISDRPAKEYAEAVKLESNEYNHFTLVTIELGSNLKPIVQTYNNLSNAVLKWEEPFLGFSNSLPETPLKKALEGKKKFKDICTQFNKITEKNVLINKLIDMLKDKESHYPDPVLTKIREGMDENYIKALSSVFVYMPQGYGTRTHTVILLSKTGNMEVVEVTLDISTGASNWERTEMQFHIST